VRLWAPGKENRPQLLTESTLLAAIGGGLGVLLAAAGTRAALGVLPTTLPRATDVVGGRAGSTFCGAISLLAEFASAWCRRWKTRKPDVHEHLKKADAKEVECVIGRRVRWVAVEMALALVLLIGAGLMIRTLAALWNGIRASRRSKVMTFGFPSAVDDKCKPGGHSGGTARSARQISVRAGRARGCILLGCGTSTGR